MKRLEASQQAESLYPLSEADTSVHTELVFGTFVYGIFLRRNYHLILLEALEGECLRFMLLDCLRLDAGVFDRAIAQTRVESHTGLLKC